MLVKNNNNILPGIYLCYDGTKHEVIGEVFNKTTNQIEVIYKPLDKEIDYIYYSRNKDNFLSSVVSFYEKYEVNMFVKID